MPNTKPQIKIVDVETGEENVRDATIQEIAQMKIDAENTMKAKLDAEAKATARQAILDRLGLTAEEAALILG